MVSGTITAFGEIIALATSNNLTKIAGSEKYIPVLQVMHDRYVKMDPPKQKMLPVEVNVLELLVEMG